MPDLENRFFAFFDDVPQPVERFAQVSLAGEKGRFAVVVRHTLRSQSTNPKPCCRAFAAYSGP